MEAIVRPLRWEEWPPPPRSGPVDGELADAHEIVTFCAGRLATGDVPKPLVVADPGTILAGGQLECCRRWPNQREVSVAGTHFLQKDSPDGIVLAIAAWLHHGAAA